MFMGNNIKPYSFGKFDAQVEKVLNSSYYPFAVKYTKQTPKAK